jgi:hypothetical protein
VLAPRVELCSPGLIASRVETRRRASGLRPGSWPQGQYVESTPYRAPWRALRRAGLMARDREVASRVRTRPFVLLERERDARKAARIAALTEKRDRISELELACLRGDSLVRLAKDVLCSHG